MRSPPGSMPCWPVRVEASGRTRRWACERQGRSERGLRQSERLVPFETYRGKRNFELGALLHSADALPVARKNLIEVSTSIQHADNFGDVIFHTIEDDV